MMNIRGVIVDDSERTVHLLGLQFASHNNSGSEVEKISLHMGLLVNYD